MPQQTTGLGVAGQIKVWGNRTTSTVPGFNRVNLSLSGANYPTTFQLAPQIQDVSGNFIAGGAALTLSAVAAASVGPLTLTAVAGQSNGTQGYTVAVYTGTITGGGSNAFAGYTFTVTGFTNASNNGTFACQASTATTLTRVTGASIAETHAATAQPEQGTAVYTGTITGGGTNAFAGQTFTIAGFTNAQNNGDFFCTASSTTTLTLGNAAAIAETHAGTATTEEVSGTALTYWSQTPGVATVSSTGLITGVSRGGAIIEVGYPTFANTLGNTPFGTPYGKIYAEVDVRVIP